MILSTLTASLRISVSAWRLPRSSMKCRKARALAVTKIFVSVALGRTLRAAWRASLRRSVRSGSSLKASSSFSVSLMYA